MITFTWREFAWYHVTTRHVSDVRVNVDVGSCNTATSRVGELTCFREWWRFTWREFAWYHVTTRTRVCLTSHLSTDVGSCNMATSQVRELKYVRKCCRFTWREFAWVHVTTRTRVYLTSELSLTLTLVAQQRHGYVNSRIDQQWRSLDVNPRNFTWRHKHVFVWRQSYRLTLALVTWRCHVYVNSRVFVNDDVSRYVNLRDITWRHDMCLMSERETLRARKRTCFANDDIYVMWIRVISRDDTTCVWRQRERERENDVTGT